MSGKTGLRPGMRRQRGMVLMGVLVALALVGLTAAQVGQRLADSRQRDNEQELLFVGEQYRQAIESYWRQSPGGVRRLPASLDDLLQDKRFPTPLRHLRKIYPDPLAPEIPLALIRDGGGVSGVYSEAPGTPFRQTGFTTKQRGFDNASSYAAWRFLAEVKIPSAAPGQPANGGASQQPNPTSGVLK